VTLNDALPAVRMALLTGLPVIFVFGFTSTVAVIGVPVQPFADGVMVNVTNTGVAIVLVNVPLIFPVPLLAMSLQVTVLSLVQVKVVPLTEPVNTMVLMVDPEQMVCDDGVATEFGAGFTITVAVIAVPVQPLAVGVMVKVTVTDALVVFVNVPLIFPEPLAKIPVTVAVLFLVQL
jgi:hypothetical protein